MSYDSTQHLFSMVESLRAQRAELEALIAADPDMAELARDEMTSIDQQIADFEATIKSIAQGKKEETQHTNCLIEFRPGAGGDEAKLWCEDLANMYTRYADLLKIKVEKVDDDVLRMTGKQAYSIFRFEAGVHRVQRVPSTENSGRIHTSTASIAIIPEVKESSVTIREEDLGWQFTRAGGNGGQNVNKVSTAVLLTHRPSGIVVSCRQERSQEQNRALALEILRGKLWEVEEEKRLQEIGDARQAIGRAARAEKIRTYNYPQNRLTDHRIPKSWHDLDRRLLGDLHDVTAALQEWEANGAEVSENDPDED